MLGPDFRPVLLNGHLGETTTFQKTSSRRLLAPRMLYSTLGTLI